MCGVFASTTTPLKRDVLCKSLLAARLYVKKRIDKNVDIPRAHVSLIDSGVQIRNITKRPAFSGLRDRQTEEAIINVVRQAQKISTCDMLNYCGRATS